MMDYYMREARFAEERAKEVLEKADEIMATCWTVKLMDVHPSSTRRAVATNIIERMKEMCRLQDREKILLVGIAPAKGNEGKHAWVSGPASEKLAQMLGETLQSLPQHYKLKNIYDTEKYPKRRREPEVAQDLLEGEKVVVVLGKEAAFSLGLENLDWFETRKLSFGPVVVVVPHPSGRCRWWNDPANVEVASAFFSGVRLSMGLED